MLPRALQNHLLQVRHLTTVLGLWMPQYLGTKPVSVHAGLDSQALQDLRARMRREFFLLLRLFLLLAGSGRRTGQTIEVVVVETVQVIIVVMPASTGAQDALVRIDGRQAIVGVQCRSGVGNSLVTHGVDSSVVSPTDPAWKLLGASVGFEAVDKPPQPGEIIQDFGRQKYWNVSVSSLGPMQSR